MKTAVIVLCDEAILIYAIPPLSSEPPDFFDPNPTHIPALFTIPLPDDIVLHSDFIEWKTTSSWYFSSSHPLYFDVLCHDSKLHRFKLIVEPDLSDASLHVIITSELTLHDFVEVSFQSYRICEDTLVSCWIDYEYEWGVYMGSTSPRLANVISHGGPVPKMTLHKGYGCNLSLCPASGRFVFLDESNSAFVLDFF